MSRRSDRSRLGMLFRAPASPIARAIALLAFATLASGAMAAIPEATELFEQDCAFSSARDRVQPQDYRQATPEFRETVEKFHFTEHYVAYLAGKTKFQKQIDMIYESPAAGFDYTLHAFPNQPLALAATEDIGFRRNAATARDRGLRVHCYFQRAVRVAPDDPIVRALYAYFYARRQMPEKAHEQAVLADSEAGRQDQNVQTYLAWSYIHIGDLDAAVAHAKQAYALGLQLPGLRNRLAKSGKTF